MTQTVSRDLYKRIEEVRDDLIASRNMLLLLMGELEHGFDLDRGKVDGSTVTLRFQVDGIDATLWLMSEAWSKVKDGSERAEELTEAFDAE